MTVRFGTDGVRGLANQDLTAELALGLGSAAARRLGSVRGHTRRIAVVGRDPRASSEMLEAAGGTARIQAERTLTAAYSKFQRDGAVRMDALVRFFTGTKR